MITLGRVLDGGRRGQRGTFRLSRVDLGIGYHDLRNVINSNWASSSRCCVSEDSGYDSEAIELYQSVVGGSCVYAMEHSVVPGF